MCNANVVKGEAEGRGETKSTPLIECHQMLFVTTERGRKSEREREQGRKREGEKETTTSTT